FFFFQAEDGIRDKLVTRVQTCALPIYGTELRRLTDGGKENNWLGPWTHDGKTLNISSNRRSADAVDAYLVDIASGELRLVAKNRSEERRVGKGWRGGGGRGV